MYSCLVLLYVVFFKQKTAYEMRISDWSSDVCSSDLLIGPPLPHGLTLGTAFHRRRARPHMHGRLLLDSAPLVAAMVHPLRDVRPFQCRILHLGPPATPALDLPAR